MACHPNSEYLNFKRTGSLFLVPVVLCAVLRLCSNRLSPSDEFRMMERHVPEARGAELATLHPTGVRLVFAHLPWSPGLETTAPILLEGLVALTV